MTTIATTPSDITPRRVPPPCWTPEESFALIKAYRDKWYTVNRGNLRAADWEAVAAAVPPKSSLQCRHKIEKLRKRYRAEKQKCLKYPGRFFSSWNLFPLLDSMEIGSLGSKVEQETDKGNDIGDGFRVKTLGDRYLLTAQKNRKINGDLHPDEDYGLDPDFAFRARKCSKVDLGFNVNGDSGIGFGVKSLADKNLVSVAFRPKDYVGGNGKIKANVGFSCDYGDESGYKMEKTQGDRNVTPQVLRLPGNGMIADHYGSYDRNFVEGAHAYGRFPLKSLGDGNLAFYGLNPKDYKKVPNHCDDDGNVETDYRSDKRDGFGKRVIDSWSFSPPGCGPKNRGNIDGSLRLDARSKASNGSVNFGMNGIGDEVKRETDLVSLLVSTIEQATESFVKVEMMKMDMAMEIEKMRMEMGLKHNQMTLESQQQIVDTLAKAMLYKEKKKRKKVEVLPSNSSRNGYFQVAAPDFENIGKTSIVKEGEACFT